MAAEWKMLNWNVNGLRAAAAKGFGTFFRQADADLFAVEETKLQPGQLAEELQFDGWQRYVNSAERKGYSGTLVYARRPPLAVDYEIPGDDTREGRIITLEYPEFYFVAAYVPNSQEGLARLDWRMTWEDRMREYLTGLDQRKPVIYTGDLNVAHQEIDIKNPRSNRRSAGFTDEERAKFSQLLEAGFADTFRQLYPDKVQYSWWSYRFHAREKGAGWRIDYFLVSRRLMPQVTDSVIHSAVTGSDHAPVELDITI